MVDLDVEDWQANFNVLGSGIDLTPICCELPPRSNVLCFKLMRLQGLFLWPIECLGEQRQSPLIKDGRGSSESTLHKVCSPMKEKATIQGLWLVVQTGSQDVQKIRSRINQNHRAKLVTFSFEGGLISENSARQNQNTSLLEVSIIDILLCMLKSKTFPVRSIVKTTVLVNRHCEVSYGR